MVSINVQVVSLISSIEKTFTVVIKTLSFCRSLDARAISGILFKMCIQIILRIWIVINDKIAGEKLNIPKKEKKMVKKVWMPAEKKKIIQTKLFSSKKVI